MAKWKLNIQSFNLLELDYDEIDGKRVAALKNLLNSAREITVVAP